LLKRREFIPRMSRSEVPYSFELSFAQERLWFLQQLVPNSPLFNIPRAVRLRGMVHLSALERSINEVIRRHEVLRTTFSFKDGRPRQIIAPDLLIPLHLEDLQALSESQREAELLSLAHREAQTPFDLVAGPLLRATLARLSSSEYVLFLTMHHIISDGWSMGILLQELTTLYQAFSAGDPSPLKDLSIQYADFALWQRHWLEGDELQRQLTYWKQHLAGAPQVLELPTDHPRSTEETFIGGRLSFDLPGPLSNAVKTFCRQEGVTVFMLLLAAFVVLLYRYTGQEDIVVGTPIANRNRAEIEELIGFFVNTLVPRFDLAGNPSFRELLGRVREVALGAYAHQDLPFEKLVEALHPSRSVARSPLFQVMFNFQGTPFPPVTLPGLTLQFLDMANELAQFDLMFNLQSGAEALHGWIEYKADLFDPSTITRMVEHFQRILKVAVSDPTLPISALPLLTDSEYYRLLTAWNRNVRDDVVDTDIHQLFTAQAEKTPDAIAVTCQDGQLTYRELNRKANQLAHYLLKRGTKPESLIGICVERSLDAVVGLLGILKAGGAYLPLDPGNPKDRLAFMLSDSGIQVVLTQQHLLERLPEDAVETICFDRDSNLIGREHGECADILVTGAHLAYVMYTSGSTGRPKGVLGLHGATLNRFHWMWQTYPFEQDEVSCQKTSLSFVDSVWEVFGPLLQGVACVIIPDQVLRDPRQLLSSLESHRVTRLTLVPSLLRAILDCSPDLETRLPELRFWITSGEVLPPALARRFAECAPHATLLNLYGSTEVAGDSLWCDTRSQQINSYSLIGSPICNTQAYILDKHLSPVSPGVSGQLYIGGQGLSRGYLNQAELTAEKFIPHPFSAEPGARLYATGDLTRYRTDGSIEYLGRLDQQVKIRGYRVEPEEVATALSTHEYVDHAVVLYRQDDCQLVAYITLKPNIQAAVQQREQPDVLDNLSSGLRRHLQALLPEYMIPVSYLLLDAFPCTPSGKIDRQRLLAMPKPVPESANRFVPPHTPLEQLLTDIWKEVLQLDRVGMNDNFFDLGGTSLSLMTVYAHLEARSGLSVPVVKLLQYPTIGSLAPYLANALSENQSRLESSRLRGSRRRAKLSKLDR